MHQQYDTPEELRGFLMLCLDAYADALAAWIHDEGPQPAPVTLGAQPAPAPAARRSMPLMEAVSVALDAVTEHAAQCGACWPGMRLAEMCAEGQHAAIASLNTVTAAADCAHDEDDQISTVGGLRRCRHCGQRLDVVVEPECAHLAWEVTSEYRNARQMWVKSRKCANCGDRLADLVEPEPHWPDKAAQHAARH
ncbi:hypothetical protein ABZT06_49695 [Streptomyces sp. NPDC005483]|uniref:hypothetical protein n=1 Tax=Streptomyces sp. NPDC005483 TaxID=3154882 RepID=UPI0033AA7A03